MDKTKIFVYLSVVFVLYALFKADYAYIPKVQSPTYLLLSIGLLITAFIFETFPWRSLLHRSGFKIQIKHSFVSIGLSILGKYIPGKIWAVVGRSSYLSQLYNLPVKDLTLVSLRAQLLVIWTGLILSCIVLIYDIPDRKLVLPVLGSCILITLLLFTNITNRIWSIFESFFRLKHHTLPNLRLSTVISVIPEYFVQWLLWCTSFYLFTSAFLEYPIPPYTGLYFALAATIGIVSMITPGGIGVREGILSLGLISMGIGKEEAISIAILSRVWFLFGECSIFFFALLISKRIPTPSIK